VNLVPRALFADPDTIQNPALRELQKRLAAASHLKLPEFLASKGQFEFDLGAPAWVTRLDDEVLLILHVELGKSQEKVNPKAQGQNETFLRMVWDQLGQGIVIPLGKAIRNEHVLKGILLDVNYSGIRDGFTAGMRVETQIEMECVPGMKPVREFRNCAYFDSVKGVVCRGW